MSRSGQPFPCTQKPIPFLALQRIEQLRFRQFKIRARLRCIPFVLLRFHLCNAPFRRRADFLNRHLNPSVID